MRQFYEVLDVQRESIGQGIGFTRTKLAHAEFRLRHSPTYQLLEFGFAVFWPCETKLVFCLNLWSCRRAITQVTRGAQPFTVRL